MQHHLVQPCPSLVSLHSFLRADAIRDLRHRFYSCRVPWKLGLGLETVIRSMHTHPDPRCTNLKGRLARLQSADSLSGIPVTVNIIIRHYEDAAQRLVLDVKLRVQMTSRN